MSTRLRLTCSLPSISVNIRTPRRRKISPGLVKTIALSAQSGSTPSRHCVRTAGVNLISEGLFVPVCESMQIYLRGSDSDFCKRLKQLRELDQSPRAISGIAVKSLTNMAGEESSNIGVAARDVNMTT